MEIVVLLLIVSVVIVEVRPDPDGSVISAYANKLYVGGHLSQQLRNGIMRYSDAIVHRISTILHQSYGAARVDLPQRRVEVRFQCHLQRSPQS